VFALLADTTFHDGLPNVVLEAMASGRPVIISPLPAAGEAVENGREGFILAAPDDLEGFVAALGKLQNAPDRAASMADIARTRVVADHDAQLQILLLQDLFTQQHSTTDS
jgi:glycosyltransferase involved in cell wall biosynthesis